MDDRYIDENLVAERYVNRTLDPEERAAFEAHIVDCQECRDRLLLAEMFHARNGRPPVVAPEIPVRARIVARLEPWQIVVILAIAGLLLLSVPTAYFLWTLSSLR